MNYLIRNAQAEDLPEILAIYEQARTFMAKNGNPTQWGSTEPPKEKLIDDIGNQYLADADVFKETMVQISSEVEELNSAITQIVNNLSDVQNTMSATSVGVTDIAEKTSNVVHATTDNYELTNNTVSSVDDLKLDSDHMMVVSPDEGGMSRAIYMANVLGLDMGMFYKRRDYTRVVDGRNPIVSHEFLGSSVEGKDIIVIDDMISSGESVLDVARQLKKRNAGRIFIAASFGLFTGGFEAIDRAYEEGVFDKILTTNLIYQSPELLSKPYYINCDLSKYIAYIIDTLNHDTSISDLLDPNDRIQTLVGEYKKAREEEN